MVVARQSKQGVTGRQRNAGPLHLEEPAAAWQVQLCTGTILMLVTQLAINRTKLKALL